MYSLLYDMRGAFHNIRINRSSAFFAVLTTTLTLVLFGIFLFFYYNSRGFILSLQRDVQMSVYLSDAILDVEMQSIEKTLKAERRVSAWRRLSKNDALLLFQKRFSGEPLLEHLGGNPLPASFEVNIKPVHQNPNDMAQIAAQFKKLPGVDEVQYGAEWLKNFSDFLMVLKILGLGLFGGLAIAVITIIGHAIRLHFYDRSEEVEIMRLMGATPRFIKNPFLLEGVLLGAFGGVLSCGILFGLFQYIDVHLAEVEGLLGRLLRLHFLPPYMITGIIISGAILGGLGGELSLTYLLRFRAQTIPKRMMRRSFVCLLALLFLMRGEEPVAWGKDDAAALDTRKKELRRMESEIKQKKAKQQSLQKDEASILSTLEGMDHRLRSYQKTVHTLERKIKKKEGELEYVSGTLQALEESLAERRELMARRVRRIYMEGSEGVMAVLIPSSQYPFLLKRLHYLKVIAKNEAEILSGLEEEQAQWESKTQQIGSLKKQLVAAQGPLVSKLTTFDEERAKKRTLLTRIRDERTYYDQVISELDKSSAELKQLIKKLEEERRRREREARESREALRAPVLPPPISGFVKTKGQLPWPNEGAVTSFYGRQKHARFDTYIFKKGIEIEVSPGNSIRAVYDGTVVYADWFKGYGMIIILDHGEDYYSVYGYLAKLSVAVGEKVDRSRMIGAVGDTGLSDGKHLYFELRHQGDPMDPSAWLQKRG